VLELRESLEVLLQRRASQLTAYQNRAYADIYLQAVAKIRVVEEKRVRDGKLKLTEAVARNLAKLMAYKDEYEVARLHASPAFLARLREQFEGEPGKDYQLGFHLAPPLLARKDADGHLVKRRYGQWLMKLFPLLAGFKGLRGTLLDPFGKTAERRAERQMVRDYLDLVDEFARTLDGERLPLALELASLPETIRGYGHVKENNMKKADARRTALLARYRGDFHDQAAA
jgi:indolepyruvate ferredoxin oxidoreductase